jgi:hypothetical protein
MSWPVGEPSTTLRLVILTAAYELPPSAMNSASVAMTFEYVRWRRIWRH